MEALIREAEAAVAGLSADFLPWVREDYTRMQAALRDAKADPAEAASHIRSIFERAHNMKGQGGSFGFPLLSEVADGLCAGTRDVQAVTPGILECVETHLALLGRILTDEITGTAGTPEETAVRTELTAQNWPK